MREHRATPGHSFHVSCGAIVFRKTKKGIKVLLLHRFKSESWPHDSWHLPKGTKRKNETNQQAVKRECLEETGYQVKILKKIGSLKSTYKLNDSVTADKITHYYTCKPIKKLLNQIGEYDEQKWVDLPEAIKLVSKFKIWGKEEEILKKFAKNCHCPHTN